jgi:hypothetical protein
MRRRTGRFPIDRATAERMLRGGRDASRATADDPLARLLAAAAAPARPSELEREEQAVAGFRTAHRLPVPPPQRRSALRSAVPKLLTMKVAALAAAVVGVGAVALAATSGAIPTPLPGSTPAASHKAGDGTVQASDHPSGRPSVRPSTVAVPSGFPPGLYRLCQDYIGGDAERRGKALGQAKFHDLAAQVGNNREKADKLCEKLLQERPGSGKSTPTSAPAGNGNNANNASNEHQSEGDRNSPANRPSGPPDPNPNRSAP